MLRRKSAHAQNTIKLTGDCNTKRYVWYLRRTLSSNCDLCSVVKPGSSTSELKESAKEEVSQISCYDLIVICNGTNAYELNELSLTLQNIAKLYKE
jgi:beta-lactamase superfamily II metal-dependent hydrolase